MDSNGKAAKRRFEDGETDKAFHTPRHPRGNGLCLPAKATPVEGGREGLEKSGFPKFRQAFDALADEASSEPVNAPGKADQIAVTASSH